jgi:hypothetical protein
MNHDTTISSTKTAQQVSQEIIGALADAFGKSAQTIERWFQKKDIKLTTDIAKEVFARKGVEWDGQELVVTN